VKKTAVLLLISAFFTISDSNASAFDGKRTDFQISVGLGTHSSDLEYKAEFAPNSINSEQKLAFSLSLGHGFNNHIVGKIGVNVGLVNIDNQEASISIGGFGASVYLSEHSPSLYVTGLIGGASITIDEEKDKFDDEGPAWLVGIGYELTERVQLELSHARAELTNIVEETNTSSLASTFVTLQYNWY